MKPEELKERDKILVNKAIAGDTGAFEQLITAYERSVYNIAYRMFNNAHDAQDVAQDIFIKIYKNLHRYQGRENSSFKSWVFAIANNTCIDEIRKRKSRIAPESLDIDIESEDGSIIRQIESDEPLPEDVVLVKERRAQLSAAINKMPAGLKNMIVLRDIQGLSYEEISEVTGMKLGTVKSKISRARASLKDIYTDLAEQKQKQNVWKTEVI